MLSSYTSYVQLTVIHTSFLVSAFFFWCHTHHHLPLRQGWGWRALASQSNTMIVPSSSSLWNPPGVIFMFANILHISTPCTFFIGLYIKYGPLFSVLSLKLVLCSFQSCICSMASSWPMVSSLQPWGFQHHLVPGLSNLLIWSHACLYVAFYLGVIDSSFYTE